MTQRPKHPYPLNDKQDFAAWRTQYRRAYHLLDTVIFAWRGSNATLRGHPGKWAAYSQAEWQEKSGLSLNAMKLEFYRLELDGLIERQPGSWDGFKPRTFIRPTPDAINFMNPRPTDYARLGQSRPSKSSPTGHPKAKTKEPPKGYPNGEPHITSFPSHPTNPTDLFPHAHAHTGGEGKAGEDGKIKKKKLILKKPVPKAPVAPAPDDDDVDVEAMAEAITAKKRARLLKQFPPLHGGAHEKFVKHPLDHFGPGWLGWSPAKQAESYGWYVGMVEKWQKGKKGKAYKPLSYEEAEFEMPAWNPDEDDAHWDQLGAAGKKKPAKK